ncbi:MAG TPA: hypothetical protein VGN98_01115, partial [Tianweitania sediminis]|nr:hypothetical protein [Tianweitania sediminis]
MSKTDTMSGVTSTRDEGGAVPPGITTFNTELLRIAGIAVALLAVTWFYSGDPFILNIMAQTFLFAAVSLSWNIIG